MAPLLDLLHAAPFGSPAALALLLAGFGAAALAWPLVDGRGRRRDVVRRLKVGPEPAVDEGHKPRKAGAVREKAARTAHDFYAKGDPRSVARLRMRLIQAGYMDPRAVGLFFLLRFAGLFAGAALSLVVSQLSPIGPWASNPLIATAACGVVGYFAPGLLLARAVRQRKTEYRNGFPDFMDLMIVCSDAGMSMEAGVDRVARELALTHPALSQNLQMVSLELRAGRGLEDALKGLADRLSLDEVRAFATLLQQSKELGTSLSGALRVFSDEMRHKRMSVAEEKAHSLPAKMSVPVTVCILPVVMMIAVIPVIVTMMGGE
ncbi:MAG TPA: type II secretion system F family protein [Mesorhizobium sp.]|jgi:tight adherence protein C|nr:type II secretion system F family protein [Mesorhizobium sp.]